MVERDDDVAAVRRYGRGVPLRRINDLLRLFVALGHPASLRRPPLRADAGGGAVAQKAWVPASAKAAFSAEEAGALPRRPLRLVAIAFSSAVLALTSLVSAWARVIRWAPTALVSRAWRIDST